MEHQADLYLAVLAMLTPAVLLVVGLFPSRWANAHPRVMATLNMTAAWLALTCALLVALLFPFTVTHSWRLYATDLPMGLGSFALSTYINSVTVIMLLLVSFVGVIVSRYSRNYLDGELNQGRFHKWLSLTLASILTLIISGNLLMFAFAWIATSLCLHQLLMFYKQRPAAVLAAHKKFVASRIGDACLLTAVILIEKSLGTMEFANMFNIMSGYSGSLPAALEWAAVLIVVAAGLKSAQFPFHGWLIQVMEAPTPVSALLHAGIVNAGAFLVIRMSPVVSHSAFALGLLAVVGLITLSLAALVMLTQTSVKVSLAWSTTAQMGFMLLECGLGLYSLAMLHLVAHSVYKAHAFLASGSTVENFRAPSVQYSKASVSLWYKGAAFIIALTMTIGVGGLFGVQLTEQPALLAAGAIVSVALTQILLQAMSLQNNITFVLRAIVLSAGVCVTYFGLHHVFELFMSNSVVPVQASGGAFENALVMAIIAVFAGLLIVQQAYKSGTSRLKEKFYVHLYNGFYIDVYLTRILDRVWPAPAANNTYGGEA